MGLLRLPFFEVAVTASEMLPLKLDRLGCALLFGQRFELANLNGFDLCDRGA